MVQTTSRLSMWGQSWGYLHVKRSQHITFQYFHQDLLERLATQLLETKIPCLSSSNSPGSIASLTRADDVAAPSLTALGLYCHIIPTSSWVHKSDADLI
jgi:hypothetical protein